MDTGCRAAGCYFAATDTDRYSATEAGLGEFPDETPRPDSAQPLSSGDGKRYVVRADEKLTAFVELKVSFG